MSHEHDPLSLATSSPPVSDDELAALTRGRHADPHRILGIHAARRDGANGAVVRAWHPEAVEAWILPESAVSPTRMEAAPGEPGLFAIFLAGALPRLRYRLRYVFADGAQHETADPYAFLPTVGEQDLYYLGEGTHERLWNVLGAHVRQIDGVDGVSFAVWAPNAQRVSVVGDFTYWDGRVLPMRVLGSSGVFELFVPGLAAGSLYKYEILTREGTIRLKADPVAMAAERPPGTASRVVASGFRWRDADWMREAAAGDPRVKPVSIYEMHLGSWRRVPEEGYRPLTYREAAPLLVDHVKRFGFTHVELLPISEFPYDGSWGYQVSGYFAPTSRYGDPDDLRFLVDTCHRNGIGVILDWVPAHFPKDDFALRLFDGTPLYEHADPRLAEHPDWGTLIFNYGRREVRSFLVASALYWLDEFHVDGLRVDAVASMLYLDYSRKEGQWVPNRYGGRENLDAVEFLRAVNRAVGQRYPGRFIVAEESTAWPGVTAPIEQGGLGFTFKWNMGWMHDTLRYFALEPVYRRYHQNDLTFSMLYEHSERFIMPLSHDEVVHGKRALLEKMPGDGWQKLANLRLLLAYQFTRPGKKLLFMGTELAPPNEWDARHSLDWHLSEDPQRAAFARYLEDLGCLYRDSPCLWQRDYEHDGMEWIDVEDHEQSVLSYLRRCGDQQFVIVLNLTPIPREGYRVGVPRGGRYRLRLCSDARDYGGSGVAPAQELSADGEPFHGRAQSLALRLPPLGAVVLEALD